MKTQTKPFRTRAAEVIHKAVKLRTFLIQQNVSKIPMTIDHCKKVLQDIEVLRSDNQFAKYVMENHVLLERMMPGPNKKAKAQLTEILNEAILLSN